ncbi:hydroxymethylglutaryl-CoA lyase [Nocardioides sp. GXZ039]|uniref:hydroxymethylglutaryl-CoA lyase n=1 Tax=Nocardioides sp. GXZ039 TaxID=3136018 RepID=UPI0030F44CDF
MSASPGVLVAEVGPRDGLQNDAVVLPPPIRVEMCERLAATGLRRVEAASFVHPRLVPAMAGAEEVLAGVRRRAEVVLSSLVLNRKGLDRALAAGVEMVNVAYPVTDSFCRRNQNATVAEAAATAMDVVRSAKAVGVPAAVTLGAAFGCPFEGEVDPGFVLEQVAAAAAAGADEIVLADTIGVGVPAQVHRLLAGARPLAPGARLGLHLHNTRNTGYANAYAALEHDVDTLDASVAGIGGCPFAPRATGNIATEDLLYLLEREGVEHGVDVDAVIAVAEWLGSVLERDLPGLVHRAGRFPPPA